jgi:hypothetical protein
MSLYWGIGLVCCLVMYVIYTSIKPGRRARYIGIISSMIVPISFLIVTIFHCTVPGGGGGFANCGNPIGNIFAFVVNIFLWSIMLIFTIPLWFGFFLFGLYSLIHEIALYFKITFKNYD